ncbi:putative phage-type endonuclease [Mycobacteroides abscessus subsp. abscessus]|nr:putative phage-type endonuclease [Mycobacteroides abscessus subsp. abscessus]
MIDHPAPTDPAPDDASRHIYGPDWAITATASKIPAMLGLSTHDSPKSMWLKMRHPDRFPRDDSNNRATRRGRKLEAGMLDIWFEDNPRYRRLADGEVTFTRDDFPFRAAATPDCYAEDTETGEIIGVENKTVGPFAHSLAEWGDPGTDVVPAKYLVQTVWQNVCGNFARTAVIRNGPLIDDQFTYWVGRDAEVEAAVYERVAAFMQSLVDDIEPVNDTRAETYEAMRLAYWEILADGDPDADWEIHPELALEYAEALLDFERAEGRLTLAKCDLIKVMGRARRAVVPGPERFSAKTGKRLKTYPVVIATRKQTAGGAAIVKPRTAHDLAYLRELVAEAGREGAA